ncbi:hypothetical protein Fmac_009752 [Flemingia macrophylla]|uniref:Proline-rich protein n=1 Tax=Flemingia macrophylla TaxID=520843 RepID=A0ABD1N171_9FABA
MGSKSLLIGIILVHVFLLSYFSFLSNAYAFDASFWDSPDHRLFKTIKRRRPLPPPPPKPNTPVHYKPPIERPPSPPSPKLNTPVQPRPPCAPPPPPPTTTT